MSKGISEIVATLLLLVITIGLVSLVAGYLFGYFGRTTAYTISLAGIDCGSNGLVTIMIRNEGSAQVSTVTIYNQTVCTDPAISGGSVTVGPIAAGQTVTRTISGCQIGRQASFRIVGPSNSFLASTFCA